VVAVDARRSWFRYHRLFADLLELELRQTEPAELAALHAAAAGWFAEHGFAVEAVRHAQAAQDWERAGRLLADHWLDLTLGGQAATAHQLIASFPADAVTANAELTAVAAAAELTRGSLEEGARYLALAAAGETSVPADRREHFRVTLSVLRLYLARQRGDLRAIAEEVQQLQPVGALPAAQPGLSAELRALALISLGIAELWSMQVHEAEAHLERGVALARRIGRPLLEIKGLAHWGLAASFRSPALAVQRGRQAIELARRHGWGGEPFVAIAYPMLACSLIWQDELEEAERWLMEGEYALQAEVEPATEMLFQVVRGVLEIARGRAGAALRLAQHDPRAAAAAHPALIRKIIGELGGRTPAAPAASPPEQAAPAAGPPEHLPEPISQAEARVLRFLQTSLSAPEIARELYVSVNTVRTHMRHLYDKLGAHRRLEAIDRARALGLLGPFPQRAL
jgi:LuxR family maltose regulon positive regulatory protein